MDPYGIPGNLAVVGFRFVACTVVATALWYGFESQILKLKRFFESKPPSNRPAEDFPPQHTKSLSS